MTPHILLASVFFASLCGATQTSVTSADPSLPRPRAESAPEHEFQDSLALGLNIELWPPNHKHVALDLDALLGVGGEGGGSVTIVAITQDEPIDATGDGHTVCDGYGIGGHVAYLRAERRGPSNGRVYNVFFTTQGGEGSVGMLAVTVPHDRRGTPAFDDGQNYDSTAGCD